MSEAYLPRYLPRLREIRSVSEAHRVGTYDEIKAWLDHIKEHPLDCFENRIDISELNRELAEFFEDIDARGADGKLLYPIKQRIWKDLREFLIQRWTSVHKNELRVLDVIIENLCKDANVAPMLSESIFCLFGDADRSFYTLPSEYSRPIHLIAVPHSSIQNIWNWLVLPHELGHDMFIDIRQLANELEHLVVKALEPYALSVGWVNVPRWEPAINQVRWELIDGTQLIRELWTEWVFELFPDLLATLMCGPAYLMQLQEILRFDAFSWWTMDPTQRYFGGPDPHPVGHVRSLLVSSAIRRLGYEHHADALDERLLRTARIPATISWLFRTSEVEQPVLLFEVQWIELLKSGLLISKIILDTPLESLGQKKLLDFIQFSHADQEISETEARNILSTQQKNDPRTRARHLLAAARIAFESEPQKADTIHKVALSKLLALEAH